MSNKNKKGSVGNLDLFQRLFGFGRHKAQLSMLEEEAMQSPFRTVVRNFRENKIAMTGAVVLVLVFLACFIYPIFSPLDLTYQDPSQQNVPPGFGISNVPDGLKNNAKQIDVGATFGIGVDKNGNVYEWGNLTDKLKKLPENLGKLEQVAAGQDHVLAVNDKSKVFTWGYDRQGLNKIPMEVDSLKGGVKQIVAGNQISAVVAENGQAYVWGNQNNNDVKISREIQGKVDKIVINSSTGLALLKDGSIVCLAGRANGLERVPDEIDGKAIDVAITDKSGAALLKDGTVVVWGGNDYDLQTVPMAYQGKITAISGGRNHITGLTQEKIAFSWGGNDHGQVKAPATSDITSISSNYYQNYAIDSAGKVTTWGLKGYLMGTDHMGRDVASRMITGGRLSLTIGAISVIISSVIGILVGGFAGYYGGKVDNILMRFAEIVAALPFMPLAMTLSGIVGTKSSEVGKIMMIMVILGVLSWPGLARLVRGQILAEREKEFVTAARAVGIKERIIIFRHIIPNVITVIIVSITISFATCLLTESGLSYLGFGISEPAATWGNMLNSCRGSEVIGNYWWRWVFPSVALSLSTISINLIGDGLRDAIDPKSNEK